MVLPLQLQQPPQTVATLLVTGSPSYEYFLSSDKQVIASLNPDGENIDEVSLIYLAFIKNP